MTLTLAEALVAPRSWQSARRHLTNIDDVGDDEIVRILDRARTFASTDDRQIRKLPTLRGRTVLSMFFESSTRTSSSFELAAQRLSADVLSVKAAGSSVDKGETLRDTVETLAAYRPDIIVIRHRNAGAPRIVADLVDAHVVNAGDGMHEHPTQCLLDLYTIRETFGRIDGLHVAIVGDVLHSRVARSDIKGLVRMGARVTIVGPPTLVPAELGGGSVTVSHDIADIRHADLVYVLRMQRERMVAGSSHVPSTSEYVARWGVTADRITPGQRVMHPGPMNRDIEIASDVADSPQALILDQVRNGLFVRMSVLYDLIVNPVAIDPVLVGKSSQEATGEPGSLLGRALRRSRAGGEQVAVTREITLSGEVTSC